jgi:alpha-mannosidase
MWQDTMLAQFHDCLPGTTIKTVVLDNLEIYSKRGAQARGLIAKALEVLVSSSSEVTIIDPLRLSRNEVYDHDGELKWLRTEHGLGAFIDDKSLISPTINQKDGGWRISNSRFSLTISNGRISSIYDTIANRELIAPGPGCNDGGLMIYEDLPLNYDAWDAEIYHLKCGSVITFDKVYAKEGGDLRQTLVAEASFGDSKAILEISLDSLEEGNEGQPSIKVKAKVDWHEKHKFLKCRYHPLLVRNEEELTSSRSTTRHPLRIRHLWYPVRSP